MWTEDRELLVTRCGAAKGAEVEKRAGFSQNAREGLIGTGVHRHLENRGFSLLGIRCQDFGLGTPDPNPTIFRSTKFGGQFVVKGSRDRRVCKLCGSLGKTGI